jgi:hypothetical protein
VNLKDTRDRRRSGRIDERRAHDLAVTAADLFDPIRLPIRQLPAAQLGHGTKGACPETESPAMVTACFTAPNNGRRAQTRE